MNIRLTKANTALILKLLHDRERELPDGQRDAVRLVRKKILRQLGQKLGQQLGHGRKQTANHPG